MRASMEHRFVFISMTKVCTHTIYAIMDKHFPYRAIAFHGNEIPPEIQDFYRWTCCRNPYTRAVSLWWSACRLHPPDIYGFRAGCGASDDFEQFIEWLSHTTADERRPVPLWQNQSEWIAPCDPIHTVVHVENLEEELKKLYFWNPIIEVPHLNTTQDKIVAQSVEEGRQIHRHHWRELYTPKAKEAVLRWAGCDFDRFGYDREDL